MTLEESKYILEKHALMFNIAVNNLEIPDRSSGAIMEVYEAYKFHRPQTFVDFGCGSCVFKMVIEANEIRKELSLKFHTFPKQDEHTTD